MLATACAAAIAAALLGGCASTPKEVTGEGKVITLDFGSTANVADAAASSLNLGWQVVQASDRPNVIVSPSSLSLSLAMLAEGAEGTSVASVDEALGLSAEGRSLAYGALKQSLAPYESLPTKVDVKAPPSSPIVHLASHVTSIETPASQPFLDALVKYYDASSTVVDRGSAKAALDGWVKQNTAGLIPASAIEVTPDTEVVVQDALLFAAAWSHPMEPTKVEFELPGGAARIEAAAVTAPLKFAAGDRWTAVRLPYDDALAADVILPIKGRGPAQLSAEELAMAAEALTTAAPVEVRVVLPTFEVAATTDLMEALPEVNLSDLGGIVPDGTIEQWKQSVRLEVGALGTVGAAVTEAGIAGSAPVAEPQWFVVDRPFAFRVLDTRTGWPLFLGVISDPTAAS